MLTWNVLDISCDESHFVCVIAAPLSPCDCVKVEGVITKVFSLDETDDFDRLGIVLTGEPSATPASAEDSRFGVLAILVMVERCGLVFSTVVSN